jgi:hypothetical protein
MSDNDVNQLFLTYVLQAPRGPWSYSKGSSNITGSMTCIPHMLPFLKWLYLLLWWRHLELVWKSYRVHKILFLCSHYLFSKWHLPVKQLVCSGQHSFFKLSRGPYTLQVREPIVWTLSNFKKFLLVTSLKLFFTGMKHR